MHASREKRYRSGVDVGILSVRSAAVELIFMQINVLSSRQMADQRVFGEFSCRSTALFELRAIRTYCVQSMLRSQIVLASYLSSQMAERMQIGEL
jgi:hypothetical protein